MVDTKWILLDTKWEAITDYLCDNGFSFCENCGLLTEEGKLNHAYAFNGFESWGEPLHCECWYCYENYT